jgi:hypothetical protein
MSKIYLKRFVLVLFFFTQIILFVQIHILSQNYQMDLCQVDGFNLTDADFDYDGYNQGLCKTYNAFLSIFKSQLSYYEDPWTSIEANLENELRTYAMDNGGEDVDGMGLSSGETDALMSRLKDLVPICAYSSFDRTGAAEGDFSKFIIYPKNVTKGEIYINFCRSAYDNNTITQINTSSLPKVIENDTGSYTSVTRYSYQLPETVCCPGDKPYYALTLIDSTDPWYYGADTKIELLGLCCDDVTYNTYAKNKNGIVPNEDIDLIRGGCKSNLSIAMREKEGKADEYREKFDGNVYKYGDGREVKLEEQVSNNRLNNKQDNPDIMNFASYTGKKPPLASGTNPFSCAGGNDSCVILKDGNNKYVAVSAEYFKNKYELGKNLKECNGCIPNGSYVPDDWVQKLGLNGLSQQKVQKCVDGQLVEQAYSSSITDPNQQPFLDKCEAQGGIWTAIGCIDPTPIGIITGLIRIGFGVMGGVALLQMVYVGIQYQRGDEGKIKAARSQLFATLSGIAVLVFSVLILRIIGVNILNVIPSGLL